MFKTAVCCGKTEKIMSKYQVIFSIVNAGCYEQVMDCAREAGATGGTVIHARGTSNPNAAKVFGISVQPEKEIVMIVVDEQIKDNVLHALYKTVGVNTPANGIAFALPVDDVVGIGGSPIDQHKDVDARGEASVDTSDNNR